VVNNSGARGEVGWKSAWKGALICLPLQDEAAFAAGDGFAKGELSQTFRKFVGGKSRMVKAVYFRSGTPLKLTGIT
jgi:hypothetical protein